MKTEASNSAIANALSRSGNEAHIEFLHLLTEDLGGALASDHQRLKSSCQRFVGHHLAIGMIITASAFALFFNGTVLTGADRDHRMQFFGCIRPAMASSGLGSERLNAQLLVDSIPALIHTARPDG